MKGTFRGIPPECTFENTPHNNNIEDKFQNQCQGNRQKTSVREESEIASVRTLRRFDTVLHTNLCSLLVAISNF